MTLQVKKRSRKMSLFCADWLQGPWNTPQEGKWHHCENQTATVSGRDHFRSPGLCLKRKFCFVEFSAGGKASKVTQSRLERNISWTCEEREMPRVSKHPRLFKGSFFKAQFVQTFSSVLLPSRVKRRRRQWHPTPVLLPGKSHGRRSLVACSPWGR